jgi:UDP-N-acetylmuramate--alanine ligase
VFRGRAQKLHFVGIGGIGMSGIAEVLVTLGYDVRGSDRAASSVTERLGQMGVTIYLGHRAEHVADADVVVISSAVDGSNAEVVEARRTNVPVIRRAEMLAELMRLKYGIAVAGTHGKTTTTSLIGTILTHGGFDPTLVIGGRLKSISTNARLGAGEYLVAEADESDGTFLRLMPTLAVVTNIDMEHLDHWSGGLPQLTEAFCTFVNKVPFYGMAVLCLDHPTVQTLLPRIEKRVVTYGFSPQADYVAEDVEARPDAMAFTVRKQGHILGRVVLGLIGKHNVLNALASIAVAEEVGVDFAATCRALESFAGIARRFEHKGTVNDIMVVDDYAHHPVEVRATLRAARAAQDGRRLVVIFQPHRYTRLRDLMEEFAAAFNECHVLLICDVYEAGEKPMAGVDAQALSERVRALGHRDVQYIGSVEAAAQHLVAIARPQDLVLTLGAGNVWQAGERFLACSQTATA